MYILAKLVFESFLPELGLEKGMLFKQHITDVIYGRTYEYDRIFELQKDISSDDAFEYMLVNGTPVRPKIVSITANPDESAAVLATHEQIGWWDDGPESDELRDIEIKDINMLLREEDGILEIEVDAHMSEDDEELITPILFMDKVTVRAATDEYYEEDDEDTHNWDDMDDLTEYDPQDFETE